MKKILLILMALASLTIAGQALTPEEITTYTQYLSTPDAAKVFIQNFYKKLGDGHIVGDCSAFVPKTLLGYNYLVAKFLATVPTSAGGETIQHTWGMVVDLSSNGWIRTMPEFEFKAFMQTGN